MLHGVVKGVSVHAGIHAFGHFFGGGKLFDVGIVELCLAREISLERRGREAELRRMHPCCMFLRAGQGIVPFAAADLRLHHIALDLEAVEILELLDITALLAAAAHLGTGIHQQPHILSPLDQTVEIVGPHCVLIFISGEVEALAELGRDERGLHRPVREKTFVAGEDYQVLEVKRPGFQRTHYLHALQRFPFERNRYAG